MVSKIQWGGNCILSLRVVSDCTNHYRGWEKVTGVVKILENLDGVGKKVIGVVKTHENLDGVGKKVTGVVKITEDLDGVHPGASRCTPMHPGAPRCTPAGAVMKGVLSAGQWR